ncbi:RusA family crossover junction endodeoxyribonuclease [Tepidibacillus fermentans]|uniref:Crossover junction endodeoxyribonuclease RusA n=1 Tax=Tepidibacillus fermentans TaxID=1281767 RepID=A0A4V2US76_9BACI|nr:RusA family crossover junction endodeoxyribonuclease [Tepidibacillus fermentans]TCS80362.1 crossover junction endodeoxyribonuclease RusA [Tepidibacillus fermentans]
MYKIIIPGRPVPKGRPRLGKNGNVYTPRRTKQYEELIGWKTKEVIKQPLEGNIALHIRVYVKRNVFPDIDNIAKSCMDGMNGIAYKDDKQVSFLSIQRIRGEEEKVEIEIEEVTINVSHKSGS